MPEEQNKQANSASSSTNFDQLLDRVETMVSAYERQSEHVRSLETALKQECLYTDKERNRADRAEALLQQKAKQEKGTLPSGLLPFPSREQPLQTADENASSSSSYSPQSSTNQDIQALDSQVVQALLNEIDSCISLLEH
jgi:type I site-specific restriction endonuclease